MRKRGGILMRLGRKISTHNAAKLPQEDANGNRHVPKLYRLRTLRNLTTGDEEMRRTRSVHH